MSIHVPVLQVDLCNHCRRNMAEHDYDYESLSGLFTNTSSNSCFNYERCTYQYRPCENTSLHSDYRYSDSSAAWVLIASIIVFFMKAGFMLLEVAFARSPQEKRYVIVLKHQDAFASAFGFFLIGYDFISQYTSPQGIGKEFFGVTDPMLWFFKFTFASNTATIVGGCLVTSKYKLRLPAAFVSAFVISGIIHPLVARFIWSDRCDTFSPYRFCIDTVNSCGVGCHSSLMQRLYVLDFAGGGAVHLIGGMAGLVVCLFAKFQEWRDGQNERRQGLQGVEQPEDARIEGFWDWMYPPHGGDESVSEAALGVFILWFCWFAFNCGSTESVELGYRATPQSRGRYPFYGVPSVIAVNMILSGASGGITAIVIATWAQIRFRTESVNANEIANGVLSALVSITAGCPFVDYWGACFIGFFAVLFYHGGCWLEYKFKINDTARVVPVHGVCGFWGLIATGLFLFGDKAECNLHASFEGLCYCQLRLPHHNYGERLAGQLIGGLIMIAVGGVLSFAMYFILHIIPISPVIWLFNKIPWFLSAKDPNGQRPPLYYRGGWLLTSPDETFGYQRVESLEPFNPDHSDAGSQHAISMGLGTHIQADRMRTKTSRSDFGTVSDNSYYGTMEDTPTPQTHTYSHSTSSGHVTYRKTGGNHSHSSNIQTREDILLEEDGVSSDHDTSDQQL